MNYLVTDVSRLVLGTYEDYASAEAKTKELAGLYPGKSFFVYSLLADTSAEVALPKTRQRKDTKDIAQL